MSAPTWTDQLAEARAQAADARARYDRCSTWNKTKRDAGEDLEFWTSKVAFLVAAIAHEGSIV